MDSNIFHKRINDLVCKILKDDYVDAIIVEGYDCVGKGRVLRSLSNKLSMPIYKPDYSFLYDFLPREYRGIVNWSYFDIMRKVYPPEKKLHIPDPVLFDRGMVSAAVYNKDHTILDEFVKKIDGYNVVHILVTALFKDYERYSTARGKEPDLDRYQEYTGRFYDYLETYKIKYYTMINPYDDTYEGTNTGKCDDCMDYHFPNCLSKKVGGMKSPDNTGCKYFTGAVG